ncbi:hypothetical protein CRUP_029441, partial [Coryphaenoides rupestris]
HNPGARLRNPRSPEGEERRPGDHSGSSSKKPPSPSPGGPSGVGGAEEEGEGEEASPDSKCPICLDRFSNLAFLDRCLHRFCFGCIQEWSRSKAECPLCKQPFSSILHSVRSQQDFQEYTLRAPPPDPAPSPGGLAAAFAAAVVAAGEGAGSEPPRGSGRRRRRRSSRRGAAAAGEVEEEGGGEEEEEEVGSGIVFEGLGGPAGGGSAAAGSVAPGDRSARLMSRLAARRRVQQGGGAPRRLREREMLAFRRALYRNGVRALQEAPPHTSETAPGGPGTAGRLGPWLRRELTVLYGGHGSLVEIVQRIITARVERHGLDDTAGLHELLRPFLLTRTQHFLHELTSFARSALGMDRYDARAIYEPLGPAPAPPSPAHSSVIAISEGEEPTEPAGSLLGRSAWDEDTPGPSYSTAEPAPSSAPPSPGPEVREPVNRGAGGVEDECLIVGYGHQDKPGGKRKYKSRHLEEEEDPTWRPGPRRHGDAHPERGREKRAEKRGRERGRRRERERRRHAHKYRSVCEDQSSSSSSSSSSSVEIIYEGKVGSSSGNKPGRKRRRHRRRQHNSSPVVITIDSNSSPDDGSHGDRLPLFSDLAHRQPIDFPDLPPLPSVRVGGATGGLGGELPVRILARGSDWSDTETNNQSKTSDVLAVDISDDEGEGVGEARGASGGEGSESRLLASIMDEIAQLGPGTRPFDGTRPPKWNHPLGETRPPIQTRPLEWSSPVSDARPLYKPRPLTPPTAVTPLAINSDPSIAKPRPDLESSATPPCSPTPSHSMTSDPGRLKPQLAALAASDLQAEAALHRLFPMLQPYQATAPDDEAPPPAPATPEEEGEEEGQGEELACRWPPVIWKAPPDSADIPPPGDPIAMTMTPGGRPSPPRKPPPSDRPIMSGRAWPCLFTPPHSAPPPPPPP